MAWTSSLWPVDKDRPWNSPRTWRSTISPTPPDPRKTSAFFKTLGFEVLFHRQPIETFGVFITKLRSPAGEIVEVVEPFRADSVVSRLLVDVEACIYHVAFKVGDLHTTQASLAKIGGDRDQCHDDSLSRHTRTPFTDDVTHVSSGGRPVRDHWMRGTP